jgi:pimeloyl-ACP methyl ester carboxylesterase
MIGGGRRPVFDRLIDDAVAEIARREPSYLARFEVPAPDWGEAEGCGGEWPGAARSRFAARGVRFAAAAEPGGDPIAQMLAASARDAAAAASGRLPLRPDPLLRGAFADRFRAAYDEEGLAGGLRAFVGRRGERPLLLVTAIGVPIAAWSKFLLDRTHGYRITIVETRHADLFAGGLRAATDLKSDADDIAAALDALGGGPCDVIAWSNGARVAIDLVARNPGLARSLVLLAPTLSGIEELDSVPSPFEEQLTKIFAAVGGNPAAASFFSKALVDSIRVRNWDRSGAPEQRARMLLALPAAEQAPMLIATLANGELLFNFMRRYFADLEFPLRGSLQALDLPLLVVTGDHDTIVSNELTLAALRRFAPGFQHAEITAAGHCIQDLQYRYFRSLLGAFHAGQPFPVAARIKSLS